MKLNFCVLSIIFAIVILAINQSVNAQSDNFKTYTNKEMKFSIQHPSNWQVKNDTESLPERVWFELSGRSLPIFAVDTEKVEPHFETHLDGDTTILKNTSLQELVEHEVEEKMSSEFRNLDLIRQNKVTIGGNDGWKMEFSGQDSYYLFEICTIAKGKIYILTYQDDPLKVPETLPLANKMVESFQFVK
jgi:PsbP-like protein